ncbi:MAG: biosynthetic-type acetolactate synthase large subunit [Oscillospiraceae bacterium]|nr:biosynthetic-type acetolactate synthase large subunit [Oscillospiraceae bacterium]
MLNGKEVGLCPTTRSEQEQSSKRAELSGAEIIIEQLIRHGVKTVFGYPGGAVLPIYDALYQAFERIDHVITAHEQGASHAADGFARAGGRTGVVIATSGPGATNLVTGIATAYLDSVPLVAITGNAPVPLLGRDAFQEVDIVGITQPIVKHNFVVRDVKDLSYTIAKAFEIANAGRKGPVLIDVPKNVQEAKCGYVAVTGKASMNAPVASGERAGLAEAIKAIMGAKRPFIYAGGGVVAAEACTELRKLAELINAPVGFSLMGLTAMSSTHELALGMCGMHGKYAATHAKAQCDVMLALGVRFSDRATGNIPIYKQGKTIIHVDIDHAEHGKNVTPDIEISGDLKEVLTEMLPQLSAIRNQDWLDKLETLKAECAKMRQVGEFTPQTVIETVGEFMPKDAVIATDVGQHQMWTMQYYPFRKQRTFLTSGGLGTMGYGMGAAIGACFASEGKHTVLFTGDGSFGMNLNELATAVSQNLPLVIVIVNNGVLGMVRQWQKRFYDQRYSQTTLQRKTDFVALAQAFGAKGVRCTNVSELREVLSNLPNSPIVIDCQICMDEEVLPMIPPGQSVENMITTKFAMEAGGDA